MYRKWNRLAKPGAVRRRRQNNGNKILIIGGIVLFVLLVFLFLIFFTNVFKAEDPFLPLDLSQNAQISASGKQDIYYLKGTSLYHINKSGDVVWISKFSSDQLHLKVGENIICLYNEQTATLLDTDKNPLFTIPSSDFVISEVVCGNSSVALLCSIKDDSSQYIRIFDMAGTEIDRAEIANTSVLKFGFYGNSDNLWYLTLDTTGVEPISRVTTITPIQQKITGLYEVYGQLVSDVSFFGSDIYISDTNSLTAYDTFGEELSEWLIYGSKLVDSYATKDDLFLAYVPAASIDGSIYTIRILSRQGKDLLIQLPSGIENFALSEKYVYCFSESTIYLYDYSGTFVKSIAMDFAVTYFRKLSDNLILLGGERGFSLFTLN